MGLDQEQPQLGHGALLLHHEYRPDRLAVDLGDPGALALRVELAQEFGADLPDQRLEAEAPAIFIVIPLAMATDDPADISRVMGAQANGFRPWLQDRLHGAHRLHQLLAVRRRE